METNTDKAEAVYQYDIPEMLMFVKQRNEYQCTAARMFSVTIYHKTNMRIGQYNETMKES